MLATIRSLLKNESGATAIEYTILIALVAVVLVTQIDLIQAPVTTIFTQVVNALTAAST